MSRSNKLVKLVFSDIVATEDKPNAGDAFLNVDKKLGISPGLELFQYKEMYRDLLNRIKSDLDSLAELEEIIVQLRCLFLVGSDIKLSIVRNEYIYARALFYRKGYEAKDIRVLVSTVEKFGNDIKELYKNSDLMGLAETKLAEAMKEELNNNYVSFEAKINDKKFVL